MLSKQSFSTSTPVSDKGKENHYKKDIRKRRNLCGIKIREAAVSVSPVIVIVLLLCLTIAPIPTGLMLSFLLGAFMIIVGMGVFTLGAEVSMMPIGTRIGSALTKSRKIGLILIISFLLGIAVTIAEPDLQVLAEIVPHIDNLVLIITVGVGVGLFLTVCMLRIVTGVHLRWLLIVFYAVVFILAGFTDQDFLGVAYDSGGVTTGPMTVPFILAFGVGVANIRSDKKAEADNFGLVALCSIGPILAVLILGFFYEGTGSVSLGAVDADAWRNTSQIGLAYFSAIPKYMWEMAVALSPIVIIFLIFQVVAFRLTKLTFLRIIIGIIYTYVGLVLFLTGVNVGFSSLGIVLGAELAVGWTRYLMIPLAMLIGWFIISAEPAVHVLEKQIEDVSSGAIPGKAIKYSLAIANAIAMGFAMLRVISGLHIMWFLIPVYVSALLLSFFVDDIYTAIAFDSGGVASGPMTATFMLQFMVGASSALGGSILQDAFGVVAMVAMMPLISIQMLGLIYGRKKHKLHFAESEFVDDEIIELWG